MRDSSHFAMWAILGLCFSGLCWALETHPAVFLMFLMIAILVIIMGIGESE